MRSYSNPFRYRTSEQESRRGLKRFLRTFGSDALDMLPEHVWDRPMLLQSAPGAGKTSLMRAFTSDALVEIASHPDEFQPLHHRMVELEAIRDGRPQVLGVRLGLKSDLQKVEDLPVGEDGRLKVFFRLLDAQLVRGVIEAIGLAMPTANLDEVRWIGSDRGRDALERLGGPTLSGLLDWARRSQAELLDQLDSVLPFSAEELTGHASSYAISALDGARFTPTGGDLELRPLVMFDDGQDITAHQRKALLRALVDRDLDLHRWFAERYQALSADEVVGDGTPDRGYTQVHLEREARRLGGTRRRGHSTRKFERLLTEIANLRAAAVLRDEGEDDRYLSDLLDAGFASAGPAVADAIEALDERLDQLAGSSGRYEEWLREVRALTGYQGAVRRRAVEVMVERDLKRAQTDLFTVPLTPAQLKERWPSGLEEVAALFLRHEMKIPYYAGTGRIARLASENIEQHVNVSGELFEEVLARITLNESLALDGRRQDIIVHRASEEMWRRIPKLLGTGRDIQRLLLNIAELCRAETYRPTAPYLPGATGTAISMNDRRKLLDPEWRAKTPGADRLFHALADAIARNLLRADLDYAVKGDRWMVLYLNRLLCPRFGLSLLYGGFRERKIEELCRWASTTNPDESALVEPSLQESLAI